MPTSHRASFLLRSVPTDGGKRVKAVPCRRTVSPNMTTMPMDGKKMATTKTPPTPTSLTE